MGGSAGPSPGNRGLLGKGKAGNPLGGISGSALVGVSGLGGTDGSSGRGLPTIGPQSMYPCGSLMQAEL
jgi:hypothetical protein